MLFFNFNCTVLAGGDIKTSIFFSIIRIYYTRHYRNFLKRKQAMPQHKSYNVLRQGTSHWNLSQELLLLRWWNWGPGLSYLGLFGTACYLCLARHFGKKCSIWPQEKHFAFVKSFLLRIFFFFFPVFLPFSFFFFCWVRPLLRGFCARSKLCFKSSFAQKYCHYRFQT